MVHVFPLLFAALANPQDAVAAAAPEAAYHHMQEFMDVVLGNDVSRKNEYFGQDFIMRSLSGRESSVNQSEPSGLNGPEQPTAGLPL